MSRILMKGNEAFAEAAIRAGVKCYFGYPITPQNEIPEYMSHELPKAGGAFIQAESELAAISMAYGAAASGGRVFISTSSPGLALMQEGIGFIASCEVPLVILNVSRGGPGVGGIQPGQADYLQVTRGGYNGDVKVPVFAPSSIQECANLIYECFDIAEEYRNPVVILADGMLGQMMEPVELPEAKGIVPVEDINKGKPWAITGTDYHEGRNVVYSLRLQPQVLEDHVEHLFKIMTRLRRNWSAGAIRALRTRRSYLLRSAQCPDCAPRHVSCSRSAASRPVSSDRSPCGRIRKLHLTRLDQTARSLFPQSFPWAR